MFISVQIIKPSLSGPVPCSKAQWSLLNKRKTERLEVGFAYTLSWVPFQGGYLDITSGEAALLLPGQKEASQSPLRPEQSPCIPTHTHTLHTIHFEFMGFSPKQEEPSGERWRLRIFLIFLDIHIPGPSLPNIGEGSIYKAPIVSWILPPQLKEADPPSILPLHDPK